MPLLFQYRQIENEFADGHAHTRRRTVSRTKDSERQVLDRKMRSYASRENFAVARLPLETPPISLHESQAYGLEEVAGMLASLGSMHTSGMAAWER